jgi:site-specific recombinase XerD
LTSQQTPSRLIGAVFLRITLDGCPVTSVIRRDYAMLALLFGSGFRRSELVGLELDEIQMRQGHWAVVDLIGKDKLNSIRAITQFLAKYAA